MYKLDLELYNAVTKYGLEHHLTWKQCLTAVSEMFEEQSIDDGKVSSVDVKKFSGIRKVYICGDCEQQFNNELNAIRCHWSKG